MYRGGNWGTGIDIEQLEGGTKEGASVFCGSGACHGPGADGFGLVVLTIVSASAGCGDIPFLSCEIEVFLPLGIPFLRQVLFDFGILSEMRFERLRLALVAPF